MGELLDVLADYRVLDRPSEDGPYDVRVPAPFLPPPRPRGVGDPEDEEATAEEGVGA